MKKISGIFLLSLVLASGSVVLNVAEAQAATSSEVSISDNHQLYDHGADILLIQEFLNAHGFLVAQIGPGSPGHETSFFGLATYHALVRYQKAQGLPATGYFGPLTRASVTALNAENSSSGSSSSGTASQSQTANTQSTATPSPSTIPFWWPTGISLAFGSGEGGGGPAPVSAPASDTTAPSVSLTAPANSATVGGATITLSATASDNVGVVGVQFKVDGVSVGTDVTAAPYSITWDSTTATNATHSIVAVARDAAGNFATSSAATVTVDNLPPVLSLASVASFTDTTATLTWTTDEPSSSQVDYGTTSSYGQSTTLDPTLVTSHSVTVTGLTANSSYHFRVRSADSVGNTSNSNDQMATTYTTMAQALFAQMNAQPDATHKGYINQFFISASSTALAQLDGLWMVSGDSQASSLNWVNPGTYTLVTNGIETFTPYEGWQTDGSSFLDAPINPVGGGTNFQLNSASFGGAIQSWDGTINGVLVNGGTGSGINILQINLATQIKTRNNIGASQVSSATTVSAGSDFYVSRTSSAGYKTYRNGAVQDNFTSAPSGALTITDFHINSGAAGLRMSMAFVGGGLTDLQISNLYAAANAYLAAIGAEPLAIAPSSSFALAISPTNLTHSGTVTYSITANGIGSNPAGSLQIAQSGDLHDSDFNKTLAAAIEAAPATAGVSFDGVNKLTFSSSFPGTFTFSRTLTSSPSTGSVHEVQLSNPTTISIIQPTATALVGTPTLPTYPSIVRGANVSGAEFGSVPGVLNTDYAYPTKANIDYYAAHGFTVIRLPFRWERLQKTLFGPLDSNGSTGDFDHLNQVVGWITADGMIAVLDPHNFGSYVLNGTSYQVGSTQVPAAALDNFWVLLANQYKNNNLVWFNLMNEPNGISAANWKMIAQSATNAIRGTGAFNRILVPGTAFTGAWTWTSSGNAAQMATYTDPANNYAFDVHQYLDSDGSGTSGTCVAGSGSTRLNDFITWAQAVPGRTGFLGEFAAGDPAVSGQSQCATEFPALVSAAENSGVFVGWTAWGGGTRWNSSYIFRLEPVNLSNPDTDYMNLLTPFL